MNIARFLCSAACSLVLLAGSSAYAQPTGLEDYGAPKSNFPTPPNTDVATAIVSVDLDYMGLNVGDNVVHTDIATKLQIVANRELNSRNYTLRLWDPLEKKEYPMEIQKSGENPNCVFALVGSDWVNVICSTQYRYVKEHIKKPTAATPTTTPAKGAVAPPPSDEPPMPKKSKKGKKNKNNGLPY